eukprot:TRINITY_DN13262_c0_g1_i1.p2 TRINITY_DN13262_c0_g1~~TRINITY_DN13262_c0_g1_i1.p2  ORF type:complete len:137 (+),score=7.59 TRINITY_DN13262_c0_g1_i1:62-472(+)
MASSGEGEEENTADESDSKRKIHDQLTGVVIEVRVKARHHIVVHARHRRKDQHRERRVDEIERSQFVRGQIDGGVDARVKRPEAAPRGDAVVKGAVVGNVRVCEGVEEAGKRAEPEQNGGQVFVGRIAVAFVREGR